MPRPGTCQATFSSGGLAAHIRTLRDGYRARRDAMDSALRREMPDGVTWTRPQGGFFVWLSLVSWIDMERVAAATVEEQIAVMPGTACHTDGQGTHNIRLAFSLQTPEQITEGVARLARAIRAGMRTA